MMSDAGASTGEQAKGAAMVLCMQMEAGEGSLSLCVTGTVDGEACATSRPSFQGDEAEEEAG